MKGSGRRARTDACERRFRTLLSLYTGAVLAHLGNALVFAPGSAPFEGASLLFAPLGPLLLAPWRETLAALPLLFAVARLGCLPAGC